MKVCAVIPAAGRGSRLGWDLPKILLPLTETETVWSVLRHKLISIVDHIHIIISPKGQSAIQAALKDDIRLGLVSLSIQDDPIGMGDAIFCGYPIWSKAESILVVWGDQVFVSKDTILRTLIAHGRHAKTIALPLTIMDSPYVQYIFDNDGILKNIKQTREGDQCDAVGLADLGTFLLSVTDLLPAWNDYLTQSAYGANTGEINFIPFLAFLSARGWLIHLVSVADVRESRGINTHNDLAFFQNLYVGTI